MGFWTAIPAIIGAATTVAQGIQQSKARKAKNEDPNAEFQRLYLAEQAKNRKSSQIAAWAPVAAALGQNVLQGINARKIRKYNEPKYQVQRLREAGLPLAAGSNITAGGGIQTPVSSFGFEQFNDNIGKGTLRSIDKKKLEIAHEEYILAQANASIKSGEAEWLKDHKENYLGAIQTNQASMLDFSRSVAESAEVIQGNAAFISSIDTEVKEILREGGHLTKQVISSIDQVLASTGLINEQTSSLIDQRQAREVILNLMRKGGMNLFESLTYMLITKYMGGGQ